MNVKLPVYLDYNSTTPVDERVFEAMLPYFKENFGNASSRTHKYGWIAREAVEFARKSVADLIFSSAQEIIFTSGATESNNLAIKGIAEAYFHKGNHIITSKTEHKSVIDTCKYLEKRGFEITFLDVDGYGFINPDDVKKNIKEYTILVSVMFANNETGTIQPLIDIGKICSENNVLFHTDAVQAVGKIPVDVNEICADLMSLSSHKIYGPKGIGALYIRKKEPPIEITEQISGGGHERGIRSGTLNVPAISGFGKACSLCKELLQEESNKLFELTEKFKNELQNNLNNICFNNPLENRLPNTLNICFEGVNSDLLIMDLNEIAVSAGSACSSEFSETSHVLKAMGLNHDIMRSSVRISIGRFTTEQEISFISRKIIEYINKIRNML